MSTVAGTPGPDELNGGSSADLGSPHGATATIGGNLDAVQLAHLLGADIVTTTSTLLVVRGTGVSLTLGGFGFTFDADDQVTGGTVTSIDFLDTNGSGSSGRTVGHIEGVSLPVGTLVGWLALNANVQAFSTIFSGADTINGSAFSDLIRGYDGDDVIHSPDFGPNTLFGGAGNDSISAADSGSDYLNGGLGADTLAGGAYARHDFFEIAAGDSPAAAAAGGHLDKLDHIIDWTNSDFVIFTGGVVATPNTYAEVTAASFDQAASIAQGNLAHGIDYTVAQVGSDLLVFDLKNGDAVVLSNRSLADISQANVGGDAAAALPDPSSQPPPPPPPPPRPPFFGTSADETLIVGVGGAEIHTGAGNDTIVDASGGPTYLRGDEGDDQITGWTGFDDANGNMGNDTISTGAGDDYAVGGKDNDSLSGDAGGDIVWGNLGNDTQDGGDGADQVRGGQGDDTVSGGAGDDYVSGDRGSDTIAGGAGADVFHGSQDAGIDRVLDFHLSEGDHVMLDPGTTYSVGQVGADTVIDMGGGHQMILVGVQMSTLTPGWILGA